MMALQQLKFYWSMIFLVKEVNCVKGRVRENLFGMTIVDAVGVEVIEG